jgi:hypothetical protein
LLGVADEREQDSEDRPVRLEAARGEVRFSARLTVLSVVLTLGLTMLFGVQGVAGWWWGAGACVVSIAGLVVLFRRERSRNAIVAIVDWVADR